MTIGASTVPSLVPVVINGITTPHNLAMLQTLYGAGNVKTPTANFTIRYNGHTCSYTKGVPFYADAALQAALTAASAPVV